MADPSNIIFPETIPADLLVTGISNLGDLRRDFLFCLDFSLHGLISYATHIAWPFNSLLIPFSNKSTSVRGILLVKSKKNNIEDLMLKIENYISKMSFKEIILIPHWSTCKIRDFSKQFDSLLQEISYRSNSNLRIFYGGKNE